MGGWIKIHRKLTDNPMWTEEPFTKGQAWIDLLLSADFETGTVRVVYNQCAKRWKWTWHKVERFLDFLVAENMLEASAAIATANATANERQLSRQMFFHIIKWKEYQAQNLPRQMSRQTDGNCHGNTDGKSNANLPLYSNKEIYKKSEEERSARTREAAPAGAVRPSFEEVRDYCAAEGIAIDARAFFDHYEAVGWKAGAALITDWKAKVRDWARTDRERGNQPVGGNLRPLQQSKSFDGKEFFEAALAKNYGTLGGTNGPMDNCG